MHTLIEHSFALLRPAADQKQVTLTHTVPQDIDLHVDVNMADTIIRNLVANAIKFTPANGTVTVSSIRRDNLVEIEVSDTGIGIPADKLGSLFQIGAKFQRKGTAGEKGTGLGLILCREFVERHGGRIWCDSTVGQGTSLRFRLPASVSRKNVAF